jgi:hypothetical protein
MALLRYPENIEDSTVPFVTFTTQSPRYDAVTDRQNDALGDDAVVMYIPIGVSVADSLQYSSFEEGLIGGAIARFAEGNEGAMVDSLQAIAGTGRDLAEGGLRRSASLAGENVRAIVDRNAGRVVNPREFMLFKAPSLRSFSFSFRFVPESETEARSIPEIIRFFRSAAYPGIATRLDYTVPQAFSINFRNTSSMIRIPQVACTSISTSYNPTSISYLREDKMPSEITMELGFQELTALTRENIEEGF